MDIFTAPTLNALPARSPITARPATAPFVTDYISSGPGYTTVRMSDGTVKTVQGSRADRNNNPGNLTGTMAGANRRGAIGVDHGGNYIFPDPMAGRQAMAKMVLDENADKSIGAMLNMYAPPGAANDPKNTNRLYPGMIANQGFNLQAPVGSLAPAQQQALLGAMMGVEGYSGAPAAAPVSASPASFPMQQRAQNSGILPMIGGGLRGAAQIADGALFNAPGNMFGAGRDLVGTVGDVINLGRGKIDRDEFNANAQQSARNNKFGRADPVTDALRTGGVLSGPSRAEYQQQQQGDFDPTPPDLPSKARTADVDAKSAASKARTLGLMGDPQAAGAIASATSDAVDQASVRGGPPVPLTKKERKKWSPESLGLIAFGLSLLGGSDMDQAVSAGMNTYEMLDNKESQKKQRETIDAFIGKQSAEDQEVLRMLADTGNIDAIAQMQVIKQEQAADGAARSDLLQRAAQITGQDPQALSLLSDDQIREQVEGTFKSEASNEDLSAYLDRYGVSGVPGGSQEKVATKIATGDFSQAQSVAAGHAYTLAQVIPQMERLEHLYYNDRVGWGFNKGAQTEYLRLKSEFARAILRKESGAAISAEERQDIEDDYGFGQDPLWSAKGVARSNEVAAAARRSKLKDFATTGGLAYRKMMVETGIEFSPEILAGGVTYGVDNNFIPTRWTPQQQQQLAPNDFGIQIEFGG